MTGQDLHSEPFRRFVVLGESHVEDTYASAEERRWPNIVADLISRYQGTQVRLFNRGISANVISSRSPGYRASTKPSALERYRADVIALDPDMVVLSYGLNDMRAGMPPEDFRQDMRRIIVDINAACNAVVVLTTVYHMSAYDLYPPFDRGSIAATQLFNLVIEQLATEQGALLADVWGAEGQADWVIHPDTVHANDLGHVLIANRVFETVAVRCSGVAAGVTVALADARDEVRRTMEDRRRPQNYG